MEKAVKIYNHVTHSFIKIETYKAFHFKKKQLNFVVSNMIKSQIDLNKNNPEINKGSKPLFCFVFVKNGNILK